MDAYKEIYLAAVFMVHIAIMKPRIPTPKEILMCQNLSLVLSEWLGIYRRTIVSK